MKSLIYCRKLPPPDYGSVYIKPDFSAAVLKGIAALFLSTIFRKLTCFTSTYNGIPLFIRADSFSKPRVFLFRQIADKPCFNRWRNRPRCRSPPSPFDFENFKKSNGGKVNAKLAERQELSEA